jgi:hypothetical protein
MDAAKIFGVLSREPEYSIYAHSVDQVEAADAGVSLSIDLEANLIFNFRPRWSPCYEVPFAGRLV